MRPADVEAQVPQRRHERGDLRGATAVATRGRRSSSTSTSTVAPGACAAIGLALHRRGSPSASTTPPAPGRAPGGAARRRGSASATASGVACADGVARRRRARDAGRLGQELVGVVLPDVVRARPRRAAVDRARRRSPCHRHDAHAGRVPPGLVDAPAQRRRRAPPRRRRAAARREQPGAAARRTRSAPAPDEQRLAGLVAAAAVGEVARAAHRAACRPSTTSVTPAA